MYENNTHLENRSIQRIRVLRTIVFDDSNGFAVDVDRHMFELRDGHRGDQSRTRQYLAIVDS